MTDRLFPRYRIEDYLGVKTELKNLEYKAGLNWETCSREEKASIVKDILAMANTQDGGTIIFGVRNEDFLPVGVTDAEFASFDQTKVNDFLEEYTDPKFTCFVYKHDNVDGKKYVSISVPEFSEIPIICKKDANATKSSILSRGTLYIRTEKATSMAVPSAQEMRELLGRAIAKKSEDLLNSIERLIKGRPPKPTITALEQYQEEMSEADGLLQGQLGKNLTHHGSWELTAYPTEYSPKRIPDHNAIKEFIRLAQVHLLPTAFPRTIDYTFAANVARGLEMCFVGELAADGYCAFHSGLFAWKGAFWEDKHHHQDEAGRPVLVFVELHSFRDRVPLVLQTVLCTRRARRDHTPQDRDECYKRTETDTWGVSSNPVTRLVYCPTKPDRDSRRRDRCRTQGFLQGNSHESRQAHIHALQLGQS